jgi:putative transposase
LLLVCIVHSAGIQDTRGARLLVLKLFRLFAEVSLVWVDQGYKKGLIEWAKAMCNITLEVVARPAGKGFQLLKRRGVVERTFAWLSNYRIHAKDYCHNPQYAEASLYAASVNLMLRRLY